MASVTLRAQYEWDQNEPMARIRTLAAGVLCATVCLGTTSSVVPASAVIPTPEGTSGNQNFKLVRLEQVVDLATTVSPARLASGLSMRCHEVL